MAERNGTFASTFIEKLQQASSDDRILHKLCQYALRPAHQQLVSSGTSLWLRRKNGVKSKQRGQRARGYLLSVIGYLAELRAVRTTACRLLDLRRGRRAKAVLSPQASAYSECDVFLR